jgi:hypothetical protein
MWADSSIICVLGKSFGMSIVRWEAGRGTEPWKESTQKTDDCKNVWQFDGQYVSSDIFGIQSKIASQPDVIFNINTSACDNIKSVFCACKYSESGVRTDIFSRNGVLRYCHPWLPSLISWYLLGCTKHSWPSAETEDSSPCSQKHALV